MLLIGVVMCESWEMDPAGLDDEALARVVVELQASADRLEALRLRVLGEWDARAVWRPLLWVIAGQDQLRSGTGACELAGGGAIPAVTAQRLGCDCDFARVLLDPHGNVVSLGRAQRRASGTQRRLLWLRDGGCRFPGCGRPALWCEAHHIVFWEDGGATDLDNLVLLCSHHHHLCHEGGFRLRRVEGALVFTRPDGTVLEAPTIAA